MERPVTLLATPKKQCSFSQTSERELSESSLRLEPERPDQLVKIAVGGVRDLLSPRPELRTRLVLGYASCPVLPEEVHPPDALHEVLVMLLDAGSVLQACLGRLYCVESLQREQSGISAACRDRFDSSFLLVPRTCEVCVELGGRQAEGSCLST